MVFCTDFLDGWWSWEPLRRFCLRCGWCRHLLSLFWASPIQFTYPHPTSWTSILILSTHLSLSLPSGLIPSGFPTKTLYTPSPHPYVPHAQPISFFSILSPIQHTVPKFLSVHGVKFIDISWLPTSCKNKVSNSHTKLQSVTSHFQELKT